MSLPVNPTPVYTLKVPSTKKEWKYRPFLVKEEKALLVAQQSENTTTMIDTIKGVIASCSKNEIDVDKLSSFDIEYIFTQLRAVSVGEIVELIFACDTCTDPKARVKLAVDLTKMSVQIPPEHTNKIPLFDDVGVVMKYPNMEVLAKFNSLDMDDLDGVIEVVTSCMDFIYSSEEVFHVHEHTNEELAEFIDNLTSDQFAKIQQFFDTMPKLRQDITYTCPVCNKTHYKYLEGLSSFF